MNQHKSHWSFWLITSLMLIWNAMGCINFIMQMNPEMLASYLESEQLIINNRPMWATIGFAVAVFGGAIGCLMLLFKQSAAFFVFIASLLGVLITMVHSLGAGIEFGGAEIIGIIIMPVAIAVFLVWYSIYTKTKGWVGA